MSEAEQRLAEFSLKWDAKFPMIAKSWRSNWTRVIPFFAHPPEIRKVIYTTNAIESLNMSLRKVTKARGSFPNDEAVFKLLYLALRNIAKKWTMPVHDWKAALNRFAIIYENRLPVNSSSDGVIDEPATAKTRAMETVEKQTAFFHRSHSPYCC